MKQGRNLWERFVTYLYDKAQGKNSNFDPIIILLNYNLFRKTYNFLQNSQWWSKKQIETYQLEQLNKLLNHAYKNVPYYTKLFDKHGLKPEDIKDFEDLQKIPFLTKKLVRENTNDLKAINYPEYKFEYMATSGSTGVPLGLYVEKVISNVKKFAFYKMLSKRAGCSFWNKSVVLRGDVISSTDESKFWKYSMFGRMLIMSSFHMSDENLPKYIKKIRKFKPKYIVTFPSSISVLARFMKKNNIESFPTLKTVICAAESFYDWQRELLNEVFQCRIFENYGHAEDVVMASSCEKSNYYHVFPEYGIVELIGRDGKLVTKEDEKGEIVATGFKNFIFPFIRYRTEDVGVYTNKKCPCGRNCNLLKGIEGKWLQEFIIAGDDRLISITALDMHSNVFDNVKQFQFYQEEKGKVILRIVKMETYSDEDTKYIKQELCKRLGGNVILNIEFVEKIMRTGGGKHGYLIQKLPIKFS